MVATRVTRVTVATTANRDYLDALVRHQIFTLRVSGRTRNEIFALLDKTELRMANEIRKQKRHDAEKVAALFVILASIRGRAWDKVEEVWLTNYIELALSEPKFSAAALAGITGSRFRRPSNAKLRRLVGTLTFEGKTLRQWMKQARKADLERIKTELVIGASQRQSPQDVARRVVGTAKARGSDGSTQRTRHSLSTILSTGAVAITDGARQLFFTSNAESFGKRERWVSVLDNRTTPICRSLDGKLFLIGMGPHPPIHFRCRSIRMAELLGGGVAGRPTYQEFLGRQSTTFQNEVLGPTRGKLFRQGGLTLDNFVDRRGWDNIPLSELVKKERQAFIAAGLDPDAY